jgi:uncharacterized membrane protein YoaK (UPF0700 family)
MLELTAEMQENLMTAILVIIIFVILFEILHRIKIFYNKALAAIVALLITFISLYYGFTKKLALRILQISAGGFVIGLGIALAIAFVAFLIVSITGKKPPIPRLRQKF